MARDLFDDDPITLGNIRLNPRLIGLLDRTDSMELLDDIANGGVEGRDQFEEAELNDIIEAGRGAGAGRGIVYPFEGCESVKPNASGSKSIWKGSTNDDDEENDSGSTICGEVSLPLLPLPLCSWKYGSQTPTQHPELISVMGDV